MTPIRIIIIDDHPIVRQGISSLLSNYHEFTLVGEADNGADGLRLAQTTHPDVILLDIRMPGESGLDVLAAILRQQPAARVLMLTSFDDEEYVMTALRSGAYGYVLKSVSDDQLVSAIRAVHRGEKVLSSQVTDQVIRHALTEQSQGQRPSTLDEEEIAILRLLVKGASNAEIGEALFMSQTTVKRKLRQIFATLNVQTRAQAAAEAVRRGLV
ncbi:MAG: response regulator transcription factor [Chloroflexi bacterium]|nr:response regulator transcription factor [Ardenticatenaceae bacterium]MBL1129588.1 DNA-binding response regulator [Chloroflexota bacterium]NOG35669.1 response regulator transcription factor [Chloroflexota bacterium]GIK56981.1 MAG: DNA-binding response regulator [Chloroflexota bacterium]